MLVYQIASLLIETAAALFGAALLLRAWMQRVRVGGRNPLAAFVFALSDPIVQPLRRVFPGTRGIDWASLVGAWLIAIAAVLVLQFVAAFAGAAPRVPNPLAVLVLALIWVLRWSIYIAMMLTIVWVVLSWVNPHAPLAPMIEALVAPLLAPFRRIVPSIGGIDLSPLGLFVALQIGLLLLGELTRSLSAVLG